jgi:ribosomal protein L11 methyltransferase
VPFSVTLCVPAPAADDRAALLVEAGASGVEVREEGVAPMPGERRPPPGFALLVAWFDSRGAAERAMASAGAEGALAEVAEQDWAEAWKRDLVPFAVGRVFVRFSWAPARPPPGCVEVVLDPGMAFGTGAHPTTALCLEALGDALLERPGASVLDVGTGSGILAIAAARLGAGRVAASDLDPAAVRVARENAARNGVELAVDGRGADAVPGRFDLVLANILANALASLAPALAARLAPGGLLFLSGLLDGQEGEVRRACEAAGLDPDPSRDRASGGWRLLAMRRGNAPLTRE